MSVNLINEEKLQTYLKKFIVGYEKPEDFSAANLKSKEYVREYREEISEAITYQWMKSKFYNFITKNEKSDYLKPVGRVYHGPAWAMRAQMRGETLYRFVPDNVPFEKLRQLGRARLYLKKAADDYIDEQLEKRETKVRLDYLKTDHKIDSMEKVLIFYNKMMSQLNLGMGTKDVMTFADGFKIVRLMEESAFFAESKGMDHCLARENYFKTYGRTDEFYSLRDRQNEPHATLQVRNGVVIQANGKGAMAISGRYHNYIFDFLSEKNLKANDYACPDMGLIKAGNEIYSLYRLPENKVLKLENLDVSNFHLTKIPDMHNVEISGTFDVSNSSVKNLKGCPRAKSLSIYDSTNFEEDFLKDLPGSVERIDGYGMPLRCLKFLPQQIEKVTVDLDDAKVNPAALYDIPYYVLRKIKFEGADKKFADTYYQAIRDGEEFKNFCSNYRVVSLIKSMSSACARA